MNPNPQTVEGLATLREQHVANTPRTHYPDGGLIRPPEKPQCQKCLQTYPCTTKLFIDALTAADGVIASLRAEVAELTMSLEDLVEQS